MTQYHGTLRNAHIPHPSSPPPPQLLSSTLLTSLFSRSPNSQHETLQLNRSSLGPPSQYSSSQPWSTPLHTSTSTPSFQHNLLSQHLQQNSETSPVSSLERSHEPRSRPRSRARSLGSNRM